MTERALPQPGEDGGAPAAPGGGEGTCPEHGVPCEWGCEMECYLQDASPEEVMEAQASVAQAREARDLAQARANEKLWAAAVAFLRDLLGNDGIAKLRKLKRKSPEGWWVGYHFGFGMTVRNRLRESGFGEKEFGVGNLDNIYVPLLEEAAR